MNARSFLLMGWLTSMIAAWGCGGSGLRPVRGGADAGTDDPSKAAGGAQATGSGGGGKGSSGLSEGGRSGTGVGGAVSGGAGGSSSSDDDWILPHSGGPVWRNSTEPYCYSSGVFFSDVWSDSRGVYALSELETNLYFNSGKGWSRVSPQPKEYEQMTGIPGGPLLFFPGEFCGVTAFDGKTETCLAAVPNVSRVFVVNAQRAFAIVSNRLLSYSSPYFSPYGSMPDVPFPYEYRLWADAEVAVVAAEAGKVYVFSSPSIDPETLQIPDGAAATAVWGFGRDDLWVAGDGRLAHYDGKAWTITQVTQGLCAAIVSMWGADHVLYFASENHLGRWRNGAFDSILDVPCYQDSGGAYGVYEQVMIKKLWGNSPSELFIALYERKEHRTPASGGGTTYNDVPPDACGEARMYWFDGQRLGRL